MELMRQHRGGAVDVEEERTAFWKQPFRMERIEFVERRETLVAGEVETLETAVAKWSTREDAARKASEVVFATARQPVVEVRVEAEDRNFARRVEVDGADRADATEWSRLAAATISGVHAGSVRAENLRIAFASPARQPFLRLTIVNEDNPPLRLTGVAVRERLYELLFFPKAGAAYRLCYGGAGVPTPHYDVGTVLATVPAGASATWALGPRSPTPDYSPRREVRGGRALLLGGVLVMVGVLAVLIARMARRVEE
jgi:hypothetical protein